MMYTALVTRAARGGRLESMINPARAGDSQEHLLTYITRERYLVLCQVILFSAEHHV